MAPGCPAGNVTNDNLYHYLYDAEGRLCAVQDLTGDAVTAYVYDAEGRRVAKGTLSSWPTACVSPTSHNFTLTTSWVLGLNGEQVSEIAVSGSANTWQHTNVFAAGRLLATYHDTNTYIELNDWLGTRRAEVGASRCYQSYYSDPYGDTMFTLAATCTPDATEQHFTGKERDAESGNDYFPARYYGSSMGRFLSPDPSGLVFADPSNPQSLNLYSYVRNNPLLLIDPTGEFCYQVNGSSSVTIDNKSQNASQCAKGATWVDGVATNYWYGADGGLQIGYNQGSGVGVLSFSSPDLSHLSALQMKTTSTLVVTCLWNIVPLAFINHACLECIIVAQVEEDLRLVQMMPPVDNMMRITSRWERVRI